MASSFHAHMVEAVKDPLRPSKCRLRLSPSHLVHHITALISIKYCSYGIKQQQTNYDTQYGIPSYGQPNQAQASMVIVTNSSLG